MLGVIAGDVIGSRFEWAPIKTIDFSLFHPLCSFTDDTVLTVATASAILRGAPFDETCLDFEGKFGVAWRESERRYRVRSCCATLPGTMLGTRTRHQFAGWLIS